jgi:ElaB/YqjD/DUF883 family membrane-anchored ribosome-binding protein
MAKKKPQETPPEEPHNGEEEARSADAATPDAGLPPEVEMAEAALRRAEAELRKAKRHYCRIRRGATETIRHARETKVSDVVENTLKQVKKHPASGVLIAAAVGFFLGRLFRR